MTVLSVGHLGNRERLYWQGGSDKFSDSWMSRATSGLSPFDFFPFDLGNRGLVFLVAFPPRLMESRAKSLQ